VLWPRFKPSTSQTVYCVFSFLLVSLGGVRLSPLGTSATVGLLYQPRMIDDDDYGAVGGMKIGRGNWSTRRKPAPVPLCPPQIPHDLTWDRIRATAVGSQQLTSWAMARPKSSVLLLCQHASLRFSQQRLFRLWSSGLFVVLQVVTNVLKEHVASIFMAKVSKVRMCSG
jgi:hypothetical protein